MKALLDQAHSARTTPTDPSLPSMESAAQLLLVALTSLIFESLAVKGPSLEARAGIMLQFLQKLILVRIKLSEVPWEN